MHDVHPLHVQCSQQRFNVKVCCPLCCKHTNTIVAFAVQAVYKLEEALAVTGIAAQLGVSNLHLQQLHLQPMHQQESIAQELHKQLKQQACASSVQEDNTYAHTQRQHQQPPQQQEQQQEHMQQRQQQQQLAHPDNQQQQQQPQPGLQWALDLGASPGAWTSYLATRCTIVISVDPAQLSPAALLPNVRHVKMSAADAVPEVEALLGGEMLDLLVCDMNQNPKRVAQVSWIDVLGACCSACRTSAAVSAEDSLRLTVYWSCCRQCVGYISQTSS